MPKILLPVDGSEAALDAVRYALSLVAEGLPASFVLANVQEPATLYEVMTAHDPDAIKEVSQSAGTHLLEAAAGLLDRADVKWEHEVASGDPAHVLAEMVERHGCEAVFMGARGVGDAGASFIGSVAQGLLQRSAVPITIVRHVAPEET